MSVTKVASLYAGSPDGNGFTTGAIDTTGASAIVVTVTAYFGLPTFTDNKGNSYSAVGSQQSWGTGLYSNVIQCYLCLTPSVGADHTWTVSLPGYPISVPSIGVIAFAGTQTADAVGDTARGAGESGSATPTVSVLPSEDNAVVVTAFAADDSYSSVTAPFDPPDGTVSLLPYGHYALGMAYEIQTTATARQPTWTVINSAPLGVKAFVLKGSPPAPTEEEFEPDPATSFGPIVWAEWTSDAAASPPAVHVFAKHVLPDPSWYYHGYKAGRLLSVGPVRNSLSDLTSGQYEVGRFRVRFSDIDDDGTRLVRGLLADEATSLLLNTKVVVRMIDYDGWREKLVPRTVAIGLVRGYTLLPGFEVEFECEDRLSQYVGVGSNDVTLPKHTIEEYWPDAPEATRTDPVPIVYGEVSDLDETGGVIDSPDVSTSVVGTPGSSTYTYGVTAIAEWSHIDPMDWSQHTDHHGETAATIVTVSSAPDAPDKDNYVHLEWPAVPGAKGYRVYGRDGNLWYLDASNWDHVSSPAYGWYNDGEQNGRTDFDIPKTDSTAPRSDNTRVDAGRGVAPTVYVGTQVLLDAAPAHAFLIAGHACAAVLGLYVDGVRVPDSAYGDEWWVPGQADWTPTVIASSPAEPYVTIADRRFTLVYGRGATAQACAEGSKLLSVNVQGIEDAGDGSGVLIQDLAEQLAHALRNIVLADHDGTGGWDDEGVTWGDTPTDVPVVDSASFTACATATSARLSGGYVGGWVLGRDGGPSPVTVRSWLARLGQSADVLVGFSRKSQIRGVTLDANLTALATAPRFTLAQGINEQSFEVADQVHEIENAITVQYARDYARGEWLTTSVHEDTSLQAMIGEKKTYTLELWGVRGADVAADIGARRLDLRKYPVRVATRRSDMGALTVDAGQLERLTHPDAPGATGWADEPCLVLDHQFDADAYVVEVRSLDLGRIYAAEEPDGGSDGGSDGGATDDALSGELGVTTAQPGLLVPGAGE